MFNRPREDWEKRDDARTLAQAEEIKADKQRYADATAMARQMADEEIKRAQSILKVAGKKPPKNVSDDRGNNVPVFKRDSRHSNPATIGRL